MLTPLVEPHSIFFGGAAFQVNRLTGAQWAVSVIVGLFSLPVGLIARLIPNDIFFFWFRCLPESRRPPPEFRILEPLSPLSSSDTDVNLEAAVTRRQSMSAAAASGRVSPVSRRSDASGQYENAAQLSFFRNLRGGRVYGAEAQSITSFRSDNSSKPEFYTTPAVRRWNVVQNAVQDGTLRRKVLDQAKLNASRAAAGVRISEDGGEASNRAPVISLQIEDADIARPEPTLQRMSQVVMEAMANRDRVLAGITPATSGSMETGASSGSAVSRPLAAVVPTSTLANEPTRDLPVPEPN